MFQFISISQVYLYCTNKNMNANEIVWRTQIFSIVLSFVYLPCCIIKRLPVTVVH